MNSLSIVPMQTKTLRLENTMFMSRLACLIPSVCAYILLLSGCTISPESWNQRLDDVGWSSGSTPVVLEYHPTGLRLTGSFVESPLEWYPSGGHWELRSENRKISFSKVPFVDTAYNMKVIDEDNILVAGRKGNDHEHIIVGRYRASTQSGYDVKSVPYDRKDVRTAIFSHDLRYFAKATKAGIVVRDIDAGQERTYLPEFRIGDILFSKDSSRLAAYVRASDAIRNKYEFVNRFKRIQLEGVDGSPQDRLPENTPYSYVGYVVLSLPSGVLEDAQPNNSAKYYDFNDVAYPTEFYLWELRSKQRPFFFQGPRLQLLSEEATAIGDPKGLFGPYLSPDEKYLGFSWKRKTIEWIELKTGKKGSINTGAKRRL